MENRNDGIYDDSYDELYEAYEDYENYDQKYYDEDEANNSVELQSCPPRLRRASSNIKNSFGRKSMYKKKKTKKIIFGAEIVVLVLLACGAYIYFNLHSKLKKTQVDINKSNLEVFPIDGYLNIALFGVDSRDDELDKGTRSDTIMIVSINEKEKNINLVSIYRDTFVQVPDFGPDSSTYVDDYTKITHAYLQGPASAILTMNKNLDMDIENFVTINFMALVKVIDQLGGIEVDVPDKPNFVYLVNKYGREVAKINNEKYVELTNSGRQVLNGYQALGYSRVRKGVAGHPLQGESDFTRAKRQREVLNLTLEKFKSNGLTKANSILESITSNMRTNFSTNELISLAAKVSSYKVATSKGFPYETVTRKTSSGDCELASPSLLNNVDQLHKELFPDVQYVPGEKLKIISEHISTKYNTNTAEVSKN